MANWIFKIELNKVLQECNDKHDLSRVEERCPKAVKEAIANEMMKALPLYQFAAKVRAVKSIAALNRVLDEVFDEADRSLVWCGM